MIKATITSKGQLTVPKDIRQRLGLRAGDKLVFEIEGDSVRLRVDRRTTLDELQGSLPARKPYPGKQAEREAAGQYLASEDLSVRDSS